jgi:hypothetical protein
VVKYSSNTGLRVGIALGAVIIIVAAIVWSKRRASGVLEDTPASTDISAATSPAASIGSADATVPDVTGSAAEAPATVTVPAQNPVAPPAPPVPPTRPAAEGSSNGRVASDSPAEAPVQPPE